MDKTFQIKGFCQVFNTLRRDLAIVQNVLRDDQCRRGGRFDCVRKQALLWCQSGVIQQSGHPDNAG